MSFEAVFSIFNAIAGMAGGGGDSSPADTMVEGASWRNESLADLQMNEGSLGVAAEKAGGNVIRNQVSEMRSAAEKALAGAGMEQGAGLDQAAQPGQRQLARAESGAAMGNNGLTEDLGAQANGVPVYGQELTEGMTAEQAAGIPGVGAQPPGMINGQTADDFNNPFGQGGGADPEADVALSGTGVDAPGADLTGTAGGKGLLAGMMNDQGKVRFGQSPGEQFQPFADMQPGAGAGAGAEAGQPQYRIGQQQSAAMLPDLQQQAAGQQASGRYSPTGNASGYRPAAGNPFAARVQQQPQFNMSQGLGLLSQLLKKDPPNPYEEQRRLKEEEAKRRGAMTRLRAAPQVAGVPAPAYAPRSPVIAGQVPGLPGKPSYA